VRDPVHRAARFVARFVAIAAALAAVLAAPGRAAAAAPEPELAALFAGPSTCPRPDLVLAELSMLLPPDRLGPRLRAFPGTPAVVELIDLGAPFQVVVGGRVREYRDDARDCAHRARVAAVFVALTIDPASIGPPPPPPPPPPAVEVAPPPPPSARARLEVAAALDAGVGTEDRVAHPGAALRLVIGRARIAFAGGASALLPVDTSVGGVSLRQWRLPIDAGIRATFGADRVAPFAELGLCAAVVSETARDLVSASSGTALELGARVAVGVRAGGSRFAPFAAVHAALIPSPAEIYALPRGVAGHTPYIWIGASAGASMELLR
jgi:hypothetical protein